MKKIKNFIIFDFIVLLLKVVGGIVTHSYTFLASGILDVVLIISYLVICKKDNNKIKGILTSIYGLLIILSGLSIIFVGFITEIKRTSLFLIIFIILTLICRYLITCFYTNSSYQKKKGLLTHSYMISNYDFYSYGVIIVAMVLMKVSKWVDVLKYADRIGTILIAALIIIKGFKIIKNSFNYMEDLEEIIEKEYLLEIGKREEVKYVSRVDVFATGGLRAVECDITLRDGISLIDVNTFVVNLQDYLLKLGDVVTINLVEAKKMRKKPKVRSKKQDARNSRSGNSKKNTKKKNTKKKNKKR
jgi:divalent metal cation (Fe/Co/Zn/Cd) transporter